MKRFYTINDNVNETMVAVFVYNSETLESIFEYHGWCYLIIEDGAVRVNVQDKETRKYTDTIFYYAPEEDSEIEIEAI